MKTIPLKNHPAATEEMLATKKAATTLTLIDAVVKFQDPERGIALNIDDVDKRLRILKAVKEVVPESTVIQLEDADHAELVKLLPLLRGLPVDEFYSEVFKDIRSA